MSIEKICRDASYYLIYMYICQICVILGVTKLLVTQTCKVIPMFKVCAFTPAQQFI